MKKITISTIILVLFGMHSYGQSDSRHLVSTYISMGLAKDEVVTQQFEVGYNRHLGKGLYITGSFMTTLGTKSMKSILGQEPFYTNGQINDNILIKEENLANIQGKSYQSKTYAIGIKKNIQIGTKAFIIGGIAASYNRITETNVTGYRIDTLGGLDLRDMIVQYGQYNEFGAKVSIETQINVNKKLGLNVKAEYLSHSSIVHLGVGTTIFI